MQQNLIFEQRLTNMTATSQAALRGTNLFNQKQTRTMKPHSVNLSNTFSPTGLDDHQKMEKIN